jgi:hypothetical protein
VLKPVLLGVGAFALVGLLMLGGWALTSATPDVPERQAPAATAGAGPATGAASGRTGGQSHQAGEGAQRVKREQEDAIRGDAAGRARDLARRARQRTPQSSAAGPADALHSSSISGPPLEPLRRDQEQAADERARADAAQRLAERRRAERLRRDEIARQADAAKRADEAEQAAERAQEERGGDDAPGGD